MRLYDAALALEPQFAEVHNNVANLYLTLGEYLLAERHYRAALSVRPDFREAHSNLLLLSLYAHEWPREKVLSEYHAWANEHGLHRKLIWRSGQFHTRERLRLGYVSADYHSRSPVPQFLTPILRGHDRRKFSLIGYSNVRHCDSTTVELKELFDAWRDIGSLSDDEAAELVRSDEVDVLIDLSGHWSGNRLAVFARQPAPVQVSYLGYPDTTGLPEIGYRITDNWADPPEEAEGGACERLIRLPCSYFCFNPPTDAPAPGELPCESRGHVVFGSFNYRPKITERVIAAWARILERVTGSQLLLHRRDLNSADLRRSLLRQFDACGMDKDRIRFEDGCDAIADHLRHYHQIDLALDTFPYNGATTTCEALWMGVPVVTLAGGTHASRVGASLLSQMGLDSLIAWSESSYIDIATALATDVNALRLLRQGLRERMQASTLTRADRFLSAWEFAIWQIWRDAAIRGL